MKPIQDPLTNVLIKMYKNADAKDKAKLESEIRKLQSQLDRLIKE